MAEPNTTGGYLTFALMGTTLSYTLEQGPATGAIFGALFFLATPSPNLRFFQKMMLMFFGIGLGYAAGIAVTGSGDYEKLSMLVSTLVSALGVSGVTSWHNYQNGGPVPKWIEFILDRLPFVRKRGDDNG